MKLILQIACLCIILHKLVDAVCPVYWKECYSRMDPHIKTFDDLFYAFHREGSYVMFDDHEGTKVVGSFQKCNPGSMATCNCGIYIEHEGTVLRIDHCRVQPNEETSGLFMDTEDTFGTNIDLSGIEVEHSQRYDDSWWEMDGNAAKINNKFMAVMIRGQRHIVVRVTRFLYVCIRLNIRWRLSQIYLRASNHYYRRTSGLCGFFDNNRNNDFMANGIVYDPNVPADVDIVADFFSYTRPYCGCNGNCSIPAAACSLANVTMQETISLENAMPTDEENARNRCMDMLMSEAVTANVGTYISQEFLEQLVNDCVADTMATGADDWIQDAFDFLKEEIENAGGSIDDDIVTTMPDLNRLPPQLPLP